ncbi:MAG: hypothetical protein LBC79_10420 [Deltaproteobacteria bacterium]|nr:hypothetical protein [Deltaproteobacteria bacterium]
METPAGQEVIAAAREAEQAVTGLRFEQSLRDAFEKAESIELRGQDPEAFERLATEGEDPLIPEGAREVWCDLDALESAPELQETLGVSAQDLASARESGVTSVPVKTARLLARLDGEKFTALEGALRSSPDGMTISEAKAFDPDARTRQMVERIESIYSDSAQEYADMRKEGVRLRDEMIKAGTPGHAAEMYAALHVEYARAFADRYGIDAVGELKRITVGRGKPGDGGTYFQLDADVNPDAPVTVVRAEPRFAGQNPLVLRKRFPKKVKDAVLAAFEVGVVNEDTGLTVGMSGNDFREHLSFGDESLGLPHLEAIAALPELMQAAKRIERHDDRYPDPALKNVFRFISAFSDGSGDYSVLLTVKEYAPGKYRLDKENPVRLYHHRVEKRMPSVTSAAAPVEQAGTLTTPGISAQDPVRLYHHRVEKQLSPASSTEPGVDTNSSSTSSSANSYTIRQLLEGVKDSQGKMYFQPAPPVDTPAFKNWFGDSKVVDAEGGALALWHQTGADIEAFDPRKPGAGEFDNQLPFGIFMKPDNRDIGLEGKRQISLYARIENPLYVADRAELGRYLEREVKGYAELKRRLDASDAEYQQKADAQQAEAYRRFEEEWETNNPNASPEERGAAFDAIDDALGGNALMDEWRGAENEISAQMKALVDKHFKESGHDGIILERDEGGIGKKTTKTYVAFEPTQIKSIHNRGAFDPQDPRILYQAKESAGLSPEENAARGLEAMNRAIAGKTDVLDAMRRDDVGGISFYWGQPGRGKKLKDGEGVAHIVAKHGEDVARKMPEVIAYGTIVQEQTAPRGTRVLIAHDGHTAVLSLYKFGNRETWLLTGWDEGASVPGVASGASTSTGNDVLPPGGRAVTPSEINQNIRPLGTNGKPLFHGMDSGQARGAVELTPERAAIRLFKEADLSTIPHESAHIFLDSLMRVIADDGGHAEALYESRLADGMDAGKAKQIYERHLAGIEQARADLRTLREFAEEQRGNMPDGKDGRRWEPVPLEGELTDGQLRTLHEVTAAAFEKYLMKGEAPSQKLASVFDKLKTWLKKLYEAARGYGIEPSREVSLVFDRMLATDRAMQSRGMKATFGNERQFMDAFGAVEGLDPKTASALEHLRSRAEADVQARMDAAALKDRKARYNAYLKEGRDAVAQDPFWIMYDSVTARGKTNDGGPAVGGINKESAIAEYGEDSVRELARRHPKLFNSKRRGINLDEMADMHGYESSDAFWNALKDRLIYQEHTKEGQARAWAEGALAAEDALHEGNTHAGDAYARYLDAVHDALLRLGSREGGVIKGGMFTRVPRKSLAELAQRALSNTPFKDIRLDRYHAALEKALKDRTDALKRGNIQGAVSAIELARIAHENIRHAQKFINERESLEADARRLGRVKRGHEGVPDEIFDGINYILDTYKLAPPRRKPGPRNIDLRGLLERAQGDGIVDAIPSFADWLLDSRNPHSEERAQGKGLYDYRTLSPEQGRQISDLLKHLEHIGREASAENKNSLTSQVAEGANEGSKPMRGLARDMRAEEGTVRRKWQDFKSLLWGNADALQWQMGAADGFANIGPQGEMGWNETRILERIRAGEAGKKRRMEALNTALAPIFERLAASALALEKQHGKRLAVTDRNGNALIVPGLIKDNLRGHWTADMVLALALNLGNRGNIERLKSGYQDLFKYDKREDNAAKAETLAALLGDDAARVFFPEHRGQGQDGLLSAQDWRDVQGIWDTIATQWADTQAVHARMHGFKPRGVDRAPLYLTIRGERVALEGGYYPARYDKALSEKVGAWTEQEDILNRSESLFAVPSAKRGHTRARTDEAPGFPLRLDTGLIMEHLNEAVTFIELGEAVRFADKVTQSPQWKQEFLRVYGREAYDAIRPNLRGLVRQEAAPNNFVAGLAQTLRPYLTYYGLGYNLKVALWQASNLVPAMRGIGTLAARGMGLVNEITAVSPFMKSRMGNIDRDLQAAVRQIDPAKRKASIEIAGQTVSMETFGEIGMLGMKAVDMACASATWMAAYSKEISRLQGERYGQKGVDPQNAHHEQAALVADNMVKRLNPDFDASSRCQFLRDKGIMSIFNMFSSNAVLFAQRRRYHHQAWEKGQLSTAGYARYHAFDFFLQGAACALVFSLIQGGSDDPDKRAKQYGRSLLENILDTYSMAVPAVGPLMSKGVLKLFGLGESGRPVGVRTMFDEPVRLADSAIGAVGKGLWHGFESEDMKNMGWATFGLVSALVKAPLDKVARKTIRGKDQWREGEGGPGLMLMPR